MAQQFEKKENHPSPEKDTQKTDARSMQVANATGANMNEQGQAQFSTGSTTGGGSNFGQGSSHLGGGSYRQGDTVSAGANYENETNRLGDSSTGTSNEGSSSANSGAAASGSSEESSAPQGGDTPTERPQPDGIRPDSHEDDKPREGERRDTGLEKDSGFGEEASERPARGESGAWSRSSTSPD